MNMLWKYEDYVNHLSHENGLVRSWAFNALDSRFSNRYTDQAAKLIGDENEYLACDVLRYLSSHGAVQHAPAILERFRNSRGIISSNSADALAAMSYEPAVKVMLERFKMAESHETFFGVLNYLGSMRTEPCRDALKSAVIQLQDTILLGSAMANLLHHHHTEDMNLVMERYFCLGERDTMRDLLPTNILSPLGGGHYFGDLTGFGTTGILLKPSEAVDNFVTGNSHIVLGDNFREKLISLLENRQYKDFCTAILFDARDIVHARYPHNDRPDWLNGFFSQDAMCLQLFEDLSKRLPLWEQMKPSNTFGADLIALIISAYFAVMERSAYVHALYPEAGIEELISALQNSGPQLPVQIQDRIRLLSPIADLKKSLSKDLSTWGDIWTVRLMGKIGSKEFVPHLIRVLRHADTLDYIYDDALRSLISLDESADESILTAIRNGELRALDSFAILEHLPCAEAYELALNRWENKGEDPMDSYEIFASCLRGIGDIRGIQKLQDIYAGKDDAGYVGDSLECLSKIHGVDIPELPDIAKRRKEEAERQSVWQIELTEPVKQPILKKEKGAIGSPGNSMPLKSKSRKVGRNEPCPCGSGKKYKKCCINKDSVFS